MGNSMGSTCDSRESEAEGFIMEPAERLPLTDECHHYQNGHQVAPEIYKYFAQRYSIFSRYDEGVCLTDEAWFGVTPEPVAREIASDLEGVDGEKTVLIDAFAGAGGNTIAFALSQRWDRIIAVERDALTLACAQNNAEVYGVDPETITWVLGDSFEYLDALANRPDQLHPDLRVGTDAVVLFSSPPWGGPGYRSDAIFDLHSMRPYNLERLHGAYRAMDHVLFLPRTSDIRQIAELAPEGSKIQVVQYCMRGASKAMAAYIPGRKPVSGLADNSGTPSAGRDALLNGTSHPDALISRPWEAGPSISRGKPPALKQDQQAPPNHTAQACRHGHCWSCLPASVRGRVG